MSRLKEALVLAIAILGLGAFLYCAMMHTKDRDRVVTVKGLSEREVKADFVIWPIVYKEVGNDLSAIHDAVQAKNTTLAKFLQDNGVEASEISWSAPEIEDVQGERYGDNKRQFRYIATVVTTVASKNVDRIREIMVGALRRQPQRQNTPLGQRPWTADALAAASLIPIS